jgi:tetratricopeptide (TPR) repeat protein
MLRAMADPWVSVRISDLDAIPVGESLTWRPVRRTLGVEAFGVNAYTAASAGDEIVEEHDETGGGAGRHEELYVVLEGHVRFAVGGEEVDGPVGTLVFVRDPTVRRGARAVAVPATVLAVGGRAGEPYQVSPWEHYLAAIPAANAGEWERAAEITAAGLERHPDNASLLYNLACFETQAGRRDDALAHLGRAYELDPEKIADWGKDDADLSSLRGSLPWE